MTGIFLDKMTNQILIDPQIKSPAFPESFYKKNKHPLQSHAWAKFRQAWGNTVVKFLDQGESFYVVFSKIPHTGLKIGTVLKGPSLSAGLLQNLSAIGQQQKAIFIKLEPNDIIGPNKQRSFPKDFKLVNGRRLFTPTSFWIDLTRSENELLAGFNPKTRYNIRLAQKKGVTVSEDNSKAAFETYLRLTKETGKRQNFFAHTEKYHRLMWEHLNKKYTKDSKKPIAHLFIAKYNNKIVSTWILFVYNNVLYYPYGASSEEFKNVMANNLMMWEAIRFGKKLGCHIFDLWGREPGKGFTKFKEGYSPRVVEFIGSWDLVINHLVYWPYRLAEIIRWFLLKSLSKTGIIKTTF